MYKFIKGIYDKIIFTPDTYTIHKGGKLYIWRYGRVSIFHLYYTRFSFFAGSCLLKGKRVYKIYYNTPEYSKIWTCNKGWKFNVNKK